MGEKNNLPEKKKVKGGGGEGHFRVPHKKKPNFKKKKNPIFWWEQN